MEKIKLGILDLYYSRKYYLLILIEKFLIIFLLYVMFSDSVKIFSGIHNVNKIDNMHVYVNSDSTSDERINMLFNSSTAVSRSNELNDYINDNFINYSYFEYESEEKYNGRAIYQASTNPYFFELFNLNVVKGRNFSVMDELTDDDVKPVIVGYGLRNKYKLGEQYEEVDLNTGKKLIFQVIGVLRKGAYYPSLTVMGLNNSLDYRYIKLIDKESLQLFSNIDMTLGSKVIFSDNVQNIRKIEQLSDEKELFDMNFNTVAENAKDYLKGFLKGLIISLILLFIFIITLIILGANRLNMLIKKNRKSYLIRICCGATYKSIRITHMKLLVLVDLIASIPTIIYIYLNDGSLIIFLFTFFLTIALNYLIIWRALKKASMKNIYDLIRRD